MGAMNGEVNLNIVLYQPLIPQNTGNIGRLCVGTNCKLWLVEPLGFSLDEKSLRRAGLDYWPNLQFEILKEFDPSGMGERVFFLSKKAPHSVFDHRFRRGDWLIFGSETKGLPSEMTSTHAERCFRLPQYGPVRSQNLANAVSATTYLALKDLNAEGSIVEA